MSEPDAPSKPSASHHESPLIKVRRIHRRDLNRAWEFLKLVFRDVNRETVEYQRPRSKRRFLDVYEEEGVAQILFEVTRDGRDEIVGYAECAFEITGNDNWMNERYFQGRNMRPLFVEELAVHPAYQGKGVGSFVLEQLEHLARVRGCTHLVLEVAENNKRALKFYRNRAFHRLDAAIFMSKRVSVDEELLPPRALKGAPPRLTAKGTARAPARAPTKQAPRASAPPAAAPSDDGAAHAEGAVDPSAEQPSPKPTTKKPAAKAAAKKPPTNGAKPARKPRVKVG